MDKGVIGNKLTYVTATAVGIGVVTVAYVMFVWKQRSKKEKPPTKWQQVGEVDGLSMYPVKSMGPIHVDSFECHILGPRRGQFGDRTFMAINEDGRFISARRYPKMLKISPSISGTVLTLTAPEMMPLSVDIAELQIKSNDFQTTVWGVPVVCRDCGDEPSKWLSQCVLQSDTGLRLVYYPLDYPGRLTKPKIIEYPLIKIENSGSFADETSYTLINQASVADLNTRLEEPVTSKNFRMNISVKNANAYEEDDWEWVKVGQVIFRNVKPCTRCIMTTIDPNTGEKNENIEPLKSLKSYRQITDPKLRRYTGDSPVMGIHLGLESPQGSVVKIGDPVYVGVS